MEWGNSRLKKSQIASIIILVAFMIMLFPFSVYASEIPETLGKVSFFLQIINTPFWMWFFRIALCICLLGILISYFYYHNKKDK